MEIVMDGQEERCFSNLRAVELPLCVVEQMDSESFDWQYKHPTQWTTSDILDWVYFHVAPVAGIDPKDVKGEAFQQLTGRQLCSMSPTEFLQLSEHGFAFYDCLQEMLAAITSPCSESLVPLEEILEICALDNGNFQEAFNDLPTFTEDCDAPLPDIRYFMHPSEPIAASPASSPSFCSSASDSGCGSLLDDLESVLDTDHQLLFNFDCSDMRQSGIDRLPEVESGYESAGGDMHESSLDDEMNLSQVTTAIRGGGTKRPSTSSMPPASSTFSTTTGCCLPSPASTTFAARLSLSELSPAAPQSTAPRRPGRPRKARLVSESSSASSSSEPENPSSSSVSSSGSGSGGSVGVNPSGLPPFMRRRRENKSKTPHLWKFMRALLEDPACNPQFIRWENKDEGVFRIVPGQSKHIALLWGQKKKNPTMTFDKLSRSLRWCRTYGFLSEVPKTGRYPKKLCFCFATHAMQWVPDPSCLA